MKSATKIGIGIGLSAAAVLIARAAFARSERTWPIVPNRGVLSGFDTPRPVSGAGAGSRRHAGVDVIAEAGDKVVAIDDGEVLHLVTGYQIGTGLQAVAVRHPDADYVYGEIEVTAAPGQKVKAGDVIGIVRKNDAGRQMLHLEAWQSGFAPTDFTPWKVGSPPPPGLLNAQTLIAPLNRSSP